MRRTYLIIFCILISCITYSQSASVKGSVIDSVEKTSLQNTVISILRKSDSVLVKFTRVEKNGSFTISNIQTGEYIILATHPYFGDLIDTFSITQNNLKDLGSFYMTPKSKLLSEVIIKSGSPIKIKGDTTIYTADSFLVRPGANVEELLRRLPGIQVGRNGEITAMGERVKKVLVDGEEFFGSDPGIATKNLRADVVKEVQVFDKKSDQAEFTGIDDGVKDKTINLKIKEDKKNGYFGKIEAAGGLSDNSNINSTLVKDFRYNNSAMINAFKGKRKIATYGIMSNTGQTNLDWQDAQNYGGGSDNVMLGFGDGGAFVNVNNSESFSNGQNGIPTNWNWGLHFSDKFNNNKQSVNSGYKFSKIDAPGESKTFTNTFLPDTSWNTNTTSTNYNTTKKHALNLTLDYTLDSMSSLKWTTRANNNNGNTRNLFYSESINEQSQFINNRSSTNTNNTDNNSFNTTLLWRHKFKKMSRTLSLNSDLKWSNSKNRGYLYSLNNYYSKGIITDRDTTDQQNIRNGDNTGASTRLVYTEPLSKELFLELNYSLNYNHNENERITNEKNSSGKYEVPIDSLSNAFIFNTLINTPGFTVRWNKKKYSLTLGGSAGISNFVQKNITENETTKYNYINFFPRFAYNYKLKPSQNLRIDYNGSTTAPSLEQLQPTRVNTDPFNVYVGNPDLDQSFRHTISAGYNSFNMLKEKNIFTNLSFSLTQNAFVQFSLIDSVGKRIYKTVNTNGVYNLNFYSDYGFKLKGTKLRLGAGPTANINRNIEYINGVKNITNSSNYGVRLNVNENIPDKFNFFFSPSFTWNRSIASLNSAANADYWAIDGWSQVRVMLPKKFEISTDINFQVRQKDPRFTQKTNFAKWNASVTKLFLKDVLEFKISVNDILDQNRGYQRNFNSSSFTESYYLTLRRFWMATITWNISKNGQPAKGFMF